jgi:WD40 repeat protein
LPRFAWFKPHSGGTPRPVGQKLPNRWGLFDMHGNVWQWCNDFYGESYYAESPREDPKGPEKGKQKVLRGGAWDCPAEKCRAAYRFQEAPIYSDACFGADSYGFRRARNGPAAGRGQPHPAVAAIGPRAAPAPAPAPVQVAAKQSPAPAPPAGGRLDPARLRGTIVFVSDRAGALEIWKMHASGKDPRRLTHDAYPDADPRFAPDGTRILYTSLRGGFPEIWVMKPDGTDQAFVTKGSQGSWSPDGGAIVFIRDNQALVRDLASGRERRVTPETWQRCGVPAWSPDGTRLAVASRHLGDIGIYILSLDGKEILPLKAEEPCCTPQWSPDGRKILCQTVQGHIHQVDVDGKNWEQQTFGADVQHDARYSPDGSLILFCRAPTPEGPWQICVKPLEGESEGDETDFVALTREGSNLLPDWHPNE